jgi:ribonuclease T2
MANNRIRYLLITLAVGVALLLIIGAILYLTRRGHHRVTPPNSCPRPKQYATNYDYDYTNNSRDYQNINSTADYFRLSLSWSPTFCEGKSHAKDHFQCQHDFGFIVHGLWPNKIKDNQTSISFRSHPRNCRNEKEISIEIIKKYFCLMPSESLMQTEWEKHGTCYWQKPEDYFEQINQLYSQIHLPDNINDILNNQTISKRSRRNFIKQTFLDLNPKLTAEQIDIKMANKGKKLREVAFCYNHQFHHIKCAYK